LSETPPCFLPPSTSPQTTAPSFFPLVSGMWMVTPPRVSMKFAKPSKSTITMWLMSMPRKSSTVLIVSAGLPFVLCVLQASEALIFCEPQFGIAA